MNKETVIYQRRLVRNITELVIIWLPILAPMVTASLVSYELFTSVLPMESLIAKFFVTLVAALVVEFSGMMFLSFVAQAESYNLSKPEKAPSVAVIWGWLAVGSYVAVLFFMISFGTVAPSVFKYLELTSHVRDLAPITLLGFIPIVFFTFKLHRDSAIMETVQTAVDSLRRSVVDKRRAELELAQAEVDLDRQRAEVEHQRAKNEALVIKAEAERLRAGNQVESLRSVSIVAPPVEKIDKSQWFDAFIAVANENPQAGTRQLSNIMTELGYPISHVTAGKWKVKANGAINHAN